ncbi:MAG: ribosome silencing factor [Muribaculaceae bacterium]|nr:ribosome silencing factor [Muribaculaceae bacterium]MBQ7854456.1 ribosome silencing factor [Muribaculaceae bacterium]MBR3830250.1 ribosome silencing factor [Muribaculaceae bacterium]
MTNTVDITQLITEGIQERKGRGISIVDLSHIESAAAQRFIICEGTSTMQVGAIADSIREYLRENAGIKPYNYDGYQNSQWIVIDYGETLVHVFLPETRSLYNLEELWSDAKITQIPDLD